MPSQPTPDLSPQVSDEVRKTTCYMCACRCGINVHMKGGKVAYIEGNRDHPGEQGRSMRQGQRRDHAAQFARPATRALEACWPARVRQVPRD